MSAQSDSILRRAVASLQTSLSTLQPRLLYGPPGCSLAVRSAQPCEQGATLLAQPHVAGISPAFRRQRCRAASSEAAELLEAEAEADEDQRQPSGEVAERRLTMRTYVSSEDSLALGEVLSAEHAAEVVRRRRGKVR